MFDEIMTKIESAIAVLVGRQRSWISSRLLRNR